MLSRQHPLVQGAPWLAAAGIGAWFATRIYYGHAHPNNSPTCSMFECLFAGPQCDQRCDQLSSAWDARQSEIDAAAFPWQLGATTLALGAMAMYLQRRAR
jgi:hypothetical protein